MDKTTTTDNSNATGIRAQLERLRELIKPLLPHEPVELPDVARDEALSRRFNMLYERLLSEDPATAQDAVDKLVPVVLEFEANNPLWLVEVLRAVLQTQPAGDASQEELDARRRFDDALGHLLAAAPSEAEMKAEIAPLIEPALAECGGDRDRAGKLALKRWQARPQQQRFRSAHHRYKQAARRHDKVYYRARFAPSSVEQRNRRAPRRKPIRRAGSRRTPAPTRGSPDQDGDSEPPAPGPGARWQALLGAHHHVALSPDRGWRT